jgi:serine/threonine protein kinase
VCSEHSENGYALLTRLGTSLSKLGAKKQDQAVSTWLRSRSEGEGIGHYLVCRLLYLVLLMHTSGIVHGDIKPSNFVILRSGDVAVIDFGGSAEIDSIASRSFSVRCLT